LTLGADGWSDWTSGEDKTRDTWGRLWKVLSKPLVEGGILPIKDNQTSLIIFFQQ